MDFDEWRRMNYYPAYKAAVTSSSTNYYPSIQPVSERCCSIHIGGAPFDQNGKNLVRCLVCGDQMTLTQAHFESVSMDEVKMLVGEALALSEGIGSKNFDYSTILSRYSDILERLENSESETKQIRSLVDIATRLLEKVMLIEIPPES